MENNQETKRLLCIVGSMDAGGAETFLMKIYRALDKKTYQMDFFCMSLEQGFYEKEIKELGGRVFHCIPKSKGHIKTFINLAQVVKNNKYRYVMRVSQHSLATLDLFVAKLAGAELLIQRSSNTNSGSDFAHVLHKIFKIFPKTIPHIKLAPSTEAAEYAFGKGCLQKEKAVLINNAIDVEQFRFSIDARKNIRDELNLYDRFVVGHVGRFNQQKNHDFLIDIFCEIHKKNSNSVLLLVGKGELESIVKEKIETLGLTNNVVFTGVRSDVPQLMMAMDVLVFPSFYEGMPNTVIEAQATGLPSIISDTITKEVKITELVEFISLSQTSNEWSNKVLGYVDGMKRTDIKGKFDNSGYNIKLESEKLINLIFN